MTHLELVARKLTLIETSVTELRALGRPAEIQHDSREQRYTERMLQIAIQAALDVAAHIVSDNSLGDPRTNRELFEILVRFGWLSSRIDWAVERNGGTPQHPRAWLRDGGSQDA